MIFNVGLGELYCARLIGNFVSRGVLGSLEHACAVAGAKLIVVMGHSNSAACRMAIESKLSQQKVLETTGCSNLDAAITEIQQSIDMQDIADWETIDAAAQQTRVDELYRKHLQRTIRAIRDRSPVLHEFANTGRIKILAAMYDVRAGSVSFFE